MLRNGKPFPLGGVRNAPKQLLKIRARNGHTLVRYVKDSEMLEHCLVLQNVEQYPCIDEGNE
jgi:hypothetical protein